MIAGFSIGSSGSQLIVEANPQLADIRFLEESIDKFNTQATGVLDGKLFGLFRRAADGSPVAGAFGWTWEAPATSATFTFQKNCAGRGLAPSSCVRLKQKPFCAAADRLYSKLIAFRHRCSIRNLASLLLVMLMITRRAINICCS